MRPTHRQQSMLDCFAPCHGDSAHQCMRRAALCSRLAKLASGQARKKLYRIKNANTRAALSSSLGIVELHVDVTRYFGLLSVRLKGGRSEVRVHTHENWIGAA